MNNRKFGRMQTAESEAEAEAGEEAGEEAAAMFSFPPPV